MHSHYLILAAVVVPCLHVALVRRLNTCACGCCTDILPGWGLTFDVNDFTKMTAVIPCPENSYGVAKEVFGLTMAPCKSW